MNRLNPAMLQAIVAAQTQPQNLLASAQDGFDPGSIVGQMLARQRAAEAAQSARQGPQKPPAKPAQRQGAIVPNQQEVLRQRMRDAGL